jgi:hypothetical protein
MSSAFRAYTEQIPKLVASGSHWALIHFVVIFPDICGALEDRSGKASGPSYKDWAGRYLQDASLSADEWYDIRNLLLHQGRTLGTKRYINYIFRSPDQAGQTTHKTELPDTSIVLDATSLAREIEQALESWFSDVENQTDAQKASNVENNIAKLASIAVIPTPGEIMPRVMESTTTTTTKNVFGVSATGSFEQSDVVIQPPQPSDVDVVVQPADDDSEDDTSS